MSWAGGREADVQTVLPVPVTLRMKNLPLDVERCCEDMSRQESAHVPRLAYQAAHMAFYIVNGLRVVVLELKTACGC